MTRPIMLGIVGDSGSARSTIASGLVQILGANEVAHVCTDDYHRFDRAQRALRNITPLHPDCNYLDILTQHLAHLRANEAVLKPVYRHSDGSFAAPEYVEARRVVVAEGLLAFHTAALRDSFDVRVYMDPPEDLRRRWKVQRDCSSRGYRTYEVLAELDRRETDSELFIRPQRAHADMVVSFQQPAPSADHEHLDVRLTLRDSLPQTDLSGVLADGEHDGLVLVQRPRAQELYIPGRISSDRSTGNRAAQLEEMIWEKMRFAQHLRRQALGEFTVGSEPHRSDSLALVQLLILYHLLTVRHRIDGGGDPQRTNVGRESEALRSSGQAVRA